MRIFSLLTAALVALALYGFVLEREAILRFAGATEQVVGAEMDDAPGRDPAAVSVVTVLSRAAPVDGAVIVRGRTEAARQVDVAAETTGKIVSSPLRKGATVDEGQLLCALDPGTREVQLSEARARLAEAEAARPQARAQIASAEAALAEALINQNASTTLSGSGFASQSRVAQSDAAVESARAAIASAESGLESAEATIEAARAGVAAAEDELERLEITAPFAGILESDTAELGTLMQPGSLCATVIQLDPMKLVGFVPETQVDRVSVGAPAAARLSSGRDVTGEVTFLSRAADPDTRTFRVEIEVANEDLALRDGQTAEIFVEAEGDAAHLLPQSALTLDDDGALGVRIVEDGTRSAFVPVRILRDTADGVYLSGLPDEAEVIVVGQEYVSDGVAVAPTRREEQG